MPQKPFIKNIDRLVKDKLKELELKPELNLAGFIEKSKRFYSTPCLTGKDELVFLKILIQKDKKAASSLKKEVKITKFLSSFSQKSAHFNLPLLIESQTKKQPYWLLHQYLPGPILGYHFTVYQTGMQKGIIEKIINTLLALQTIPFQKIPGLYQKTFPEILKTAQYFENKLKLKKAEKTIDFVQIRQFLKKQKKYFKKENFVLAHGDFTLANLFLNNGRLYLTDWELAEINNFTSDLSRLWIQTYQYPIWRKSLVLRFLERQPASKKPVFKQLFRTMAIIEAIKELACDYLAHPQTTQLKKMCQKTIKASFKGFDNLLNIK